MLDLNGQTILSIEGLDKREMSDGGLSFEEVKIKTDRGITFVKCSEDSDEIVFSTRSNYEEFKKISEINYDNTVAGWSWVGKNQNGYNDIFLLSLSGIRPDLIFLSESGRVSLLYAKNRQVR